MELSASEDGRRCLWFATPRLGAPSEVWLLRQFCGLRRFRPLALTWEDHRETVPTKMLVHEMMPPLPARRSEEGVRKWLGRARRWREGNYLAATPAELRNLERLAEAERPAAILAQYGQTGLRLRPAARALGLPLVVHFHGHDLSYALDNRWYRWSLERELPHFDRVVVVGAHQKAKLIEFGVEPGRIALIPCGVPVEMFKPPAERPQGPPRFLVVSRLVESKGVDVTLAAFAALRKNHPEATLTIVGDGPDRAALEAQAAPMGEAVTFTGAVPSEEVRARMESATIYLQHSLGRPGHPLGSEGSPVAIAEAQAMALPVVVSVCGGSEDLVREGETGFIVPQRDVEAMRAAMARLVADPVRAAEMGAAGRRHVGAEYDTKRQIARLEEIVSEAAGLTLKEGRTA